MPELVPNVNSIFQDTCPALSPDEHRLYFASTRPGGCGGGDLYVARRHDRKDDFGWQAPEHLGCVVNSPANDNCDNVFEDESGTEVLYFGSDRPGGVGRRDIYASRMGADGTFGPPEPVAELNTSYDDHCPAVRRDGLELIFMSDRPGGLGLADYWMATRASTKDPWSVPVNLTVLNSPAYDSGKMTFSFDGRQFYFYSNRPGGYGGYDVYVATREKLRQ
jgi:Tol biopolymer transport system component